jgi:hypothetical protein
VSCMSLNLGLLPMLFYLAALRRLKTHGIFSEAGIFSVDNMQPLFF